jgi:hypothetical protein
MQEEICSEIQGVFKGWLAQSKSSVDGLPKLYTTDFTELIDFGDRHPGGIDFFSIFSTRDGKNELQLSVNSAHVPGEKAYKNKSGWKVGNAHSANID